MSDQPARQPFRFRIPWVMNPMPTATRPPTQPEPTQPTPSAPPPFLPPGVASQPPSPSRTASQPPSPKVVPSQPQIPPKTQSQRPSPTRVVPPRIVSQPPPPALRAPSRPEVLPRTEPKVPSPTRTAPQSRVASQPSSPSRPTPAQPQATAKTEPELASFAPTVPAARVVSQPPSPPRTSQPQPETQKTSQPSSPSLIATKPERASQPPSPSRPTSTKISSQPPSPMRTGIQPTTQAPTKAPSPSKSSASQPEEPYDKSVPSQPTMYKPEPEYPPKGEAPSEPPSQPQDQTQARTTVQPTLEKKQQLETPVAPKADREEKSMISADEEPKKRTIPERFRMASAPHLRPRDQLDTASEEEKQAPKKQMHTDEKEVLATVTRVKERKTAVPVPQKERKESTQHHPKPSVPQGERTALHEEIRDDISKFVHKVSTEHPKQGTDENPVSVITVAGENRGASMHLDSNAGRKDEPIHIHRGYKLNQESNSDVTTDGESNSKARRQSASGIREDQASMVYINSNTQSINNSIIFSSSVNEGSPGVHLVFSRNPKERAQPSGKTESVQARRADFNIMQPEKLTYEPTVRRRCLRGLLLEPSESDPDNPDKPRRHGCRYSCEQKKKAKDNANEG